MCVCVFTASKSNKWQELQSPHRRGWGPLGQHLLFFPLTPEKSLPQFLLPPCGGWAAGFSQASLQVKPGPQGPSKVSMPFMGFFFWAEDLVVVFLLGRSSSTPHLYCIQFNFVCGCVMKLCSLIQGVWTLQSQYYEEHENLPTSGGEISVSAQKIVSVQKRGTQLLWFTKYSTYCIF